MSNSNFSKQELATLREKQEQLKTALGKSYRFNDVHAAESGHTITIDMLKDMFENGTINQEYEGGELSQLSKYHGKILWSLEIGNAKLDVELSQYDSQRSGIFDNMVFLITCGKNYDGHWEPINEDVLNGDVLSLKNINSIADLETTMFGILDREVTQNLKRGLDFSYGITNGANFEEYSGLPLKDKELVCNEYYKLNDDETTVYKVLGIDGERALLHRTIDPALGQDPVPYVVVSNPTVSKQGFISWDSGNYSAEVPTDVKLPVYTESAATARKRDELHLFRASNKLNRICAAEIETAINKTRQPTDMPGANHFDFPSAFAELTEKFGAERVNTVLAITLDSAKWDSRYSDANRDWARNIEMPYEEYRSGCYVNTHPAILDGFINHARKEWGKAAIGVPKEDDTVINDKSQSTLSNNVTANEISKESSQKRSIREKLKEPLPKSTINKHAKNTQEKGR